MRQPGLREAAHLEGVLWSPCKQPVSAWAGRAWLPRRRRAHSPGGTEPSPGLWCVLVTRSVAAQGVSVAHALCSAIRNSSWRSLGWERLVQGEGELGRGQAPGQAQAWWAIHTSSSEAEGRGSPWGSIHPAGHSSVVQTISSASTCISISPTRSSLTTAPETSAGG